MRIKWTFQMLVEEALKYSTRGEFRKNSYRAYDAARERKILDRICGHMTHIYVRWTDEMLHQEALKYTTTGEFYKNSFLAYHASIKRGIFDKICSHMEKSRHLWTNEEIHLQALRFKTRWEFQRNSSAYGVAKKRGILDQVCSHMKHSSGSSIDERELLKNIKDVFPNAKLLRDKKVKIENKPHIHGFDIDIFIPELNRGIEFDGARYHSFEYMRADKSKRFWSDDDILNYHEIKDAWFLSKSIQILHIKEKDWKKDKIGCVRKCLDFLGNL